MKDRKFLTCRHDVHGAAQQPAQVDRFRGCHLLCQRLLLCRLSGNGTDCLSQLFFTLIFWAKEKSLPFILENLLLLFILYVYCMTKSSDLLLFIFELRKRGLL